ncbi:hypothetical protein WA026_021602 [Henosepilachna vigintioctopunctata]|uniref:Uncharacterized protein n=1 Tax=Henosepilachna vigintioctopunctata TaxID=420089 RepID=A0AAW1V601_9CUCU
MNKLINRSSFEDKKQQKTIDHEYVSAILTGLSILVNYIQSSLNYLQYKTNILHILVAYSSYNRWCSHAAPEVDFETETSPPPTETPFGTDTKLGNFQQQLGATFTYDKL